MLQIELKTRIERTDQRLQRRKTGEQAGLLSGNKDFLVPYHLEELLLPLLAASGKELPRAPIAIGAEAKVRMLVDQIDGFIEDSTLDFRHFGLIVGISNIDVLVRNGKDCPFLAGRKNNI